MKNQDLNQILKSARVPERPEGYWEEFPDRVFAGLRAANRSQPEVGRGRLFFAWSVGIACVCLLLGIAVVGHWRSTHADGNAFALVQNEKTLMEVLKLFPGRVRAVVQDEQGLHMVLSENSDVPVSTPLLIRICEGKQCRVVVTFSGQELQIAGERVEVLADAQGKVMLVGDRLFWSDKEQVLVSGHLRIEARPLTYVL